MCMYQRCFTLSGNVGQNKTVSFNLYIICIIQGEIKSISTEM